MLRSHVPLHGKGAGQHKDPLRRLINRVIVVVCKLCLLRPQVLPREESVLCVYVCAAAKPAPISVCWNPMHCGTEGGDVWSGNRNRTRRVQGCSVDMCWCAVFVVAPATGPSLLFEPGQVWVRDQCSVACMYLLSLLCPLWAFGW